MPRYFFHVDGGVQRIDREGTELRGPATAHTAAVVAAGDMLRDADGLREGSWSMRVTDDRGATVSDIRIVVERRRPA